MSAHILVVDDDRIILESLAEFLRLEGYEVETADGRRLPAARRGVDLRRDLVLLSCDGADGEWPALPFLDPDSLRPGQAALSWSATFGPPGTAAPFYGIVSGLHRQQDSVQTDAPFLHATAGGPLTDLDGRGIGFFTQLYGEENVQSGVAFAIPWPSLAETLPALRRGEEIGVPYLGIALAPGTIEERGVLVLQVAAGGPAAAAGVEEADRILSCGGRAVNNRIQMVAFIQDRLPGARIVLEVEKARTGETVRLGVTLARRPRTRE